MEQDTSNGGHDARGHLQQLDADGAHLSASQFRAGQHHAAQILQQGWGEAGLNIEIVEFDIGTAYGKLEEGDYNAMVSYITSDTNDQDFLASIQADHTVFGGFFSNYNNPQVTEWLTQARQTSVPEERQDLYCKAQQQVYGDGYSVPLNFTPAVNSYQDNVRGWRNLTTGWWWLKDVWLDE